MPAIRDSIPCLERLAAMGRSCGNIHKPVRPTPGTLAIRTVLDSAVP